MRRKNVELDGLANGEVGGDVVKNLKVLDRRSKVNNHQQFSSNNDYHTENKSILFMPFYHHILTPFIRKSKMRW